MHVRSVTVLLGLVLVVAACSGDDSAGSTTTTVTTTTTSAPTATATTTSTVTASTTTTQAPNTSSDPGLVGDGTPGSCLVLEEIYCSSGVAAHLQEGGFDVYGIAFSVPAWETPIFSPYDGAVRVFVRSVAGVGAPYSVFVEREDGINMGIVFNPTAISPRRDRGDNGPVELGELLGYPTPLDAARYIEPGGPYNLFVFPTTFPPPILSEERIVLMQEEFYALFGFPVPAELLKLIALEFGTSE